MILLFLLLRFTFSRGFVACSPRLSALSMPIELCARLATCLQIVDQPNCLRPADFTAATNKARALRK